jgi:hypothetical protein
LKKEIWKMQTARATAVVTCTYAAGFGLPAIPVAGYLLAHGRLPTFLNLFEMYGGPWSARVDKETFIAMLAAFSGVTAVTAWSGWLLWRGRKAGAILNLALIPVEAVFWLGFALPLPWPVAVARTALVAASWSSLGNGRSRRTLIQTRHAYSTRADRS